MGTAWGSTAKQKNDWSSHPKPLVLVRIWPQDTRSAKHFYSTDQIVDIHKQVVVFYVIHFQALHDEAWRIQKHAEDEALASSGETVTIGVPTKKYRKSLLD